MTMTSSTGELYGDTATVAHYESLGELQPPEAHLFESYVAHGLRILDIGVGGGRTTPWLSSRASHYVGVDYAPEMVEACRRRFDGLDFRVMDAADLSAFADRSFDVVVFSFNGIGHLYPDAARRACLREIHRVLAEDGVFLFSVHNARTLLPHLAKSAPPFAWPRTLARLVSANAGRAAAALCSPAFWRDRGYMVIPLHGMRVRLFRSGRKPMIRELSEEGFCLRDWVSDRYPRNAPNLAIRWYYYAAAKTAVAETMRR